VYNTPGRTYFSCVHASVVDVTIGPVSGEIYSDQGKRSDRVLSDESARDQFIQTIVDCDPLKASLVSADQLVQIQLRKLAVNAVINPLSARFDCINGDIFKRDDIRKLIRPMIEEISAVLQAILLARNPSTSVSVLRQFDSETLENYIMEIGVKVAKNSSSMREDVRAGRQSEIHYINGYIVRQGRTFDIPCPINSKIVDTIVEIERKKQGSTSEATK
jgi:2-dehydropantoate 2-reductase